MEKSSERCRVGTVRARILLPAGVVRQAEQQRGGEQHRRDAARRQQQAHRRGHATELQRAHGAEPGQQGGAAGQEQHRAQRRHPGEVPDALRRQPRAPGHQRRHHGEGDRRHGDHRLHQQRGEERTDPTGFGRALRHGHPRLPFPRRDDAGIARRRATPLTAAARGGAAPAPGQPARGT
jgi:hypothetical protein